MKAPPITPGPWAAQYDNPCCVIPGHTIKTAGGAHTPIGIVCKGTGASPKGVKEQKANACAFAALPDLLEALENIMFMRIHDVGFREDLSAERKRAQDMAEAALIKAGYTFDS